MSNKFTPYKVGICLKAKRVVLLICSLFLIAAFPSSAIETSIQLHKADQSGAYGVTVGIGDNFFNNKEFNWSVSYNHLEDINITWNEDDIDFALDTVDLALSYRYYPKSYNSFIKSMIFEFQAGAGVVITENKFIWPELNEEKYFSEQGDVNGLLGFVVHKKISKRMAMQLGVKHYPGYSEFGDISSVYLGFSYTFGKQMGY